MKAMRTLLCCTAVLVSAALPVNADLIAHWPILGDGTPLVIEDATGNGRNGAFIDTADPAAPVYAEGYPCEADGALQLNGTGQYVDVSGYFGTGIYLNQAFTVAMWVKGAPQADMRVFAEASTANNTPLVTLGTRTTTDGVLKLYIRGATTVERFSTRVAFDNTWHHIAWVDTRIGTGASVWSQAFVYIDGVLDSTFAYARPAFTGTNALNTTAIGAVKRAAIGNRFTGGIDDVRVYTHALSAADVRALVGRPCAGCAGEGDPDYRDTQITGVTVTGPAGNVAGWYKITAAATDATADPIWYTIVARSPAWSEAWAAAGTAASTFDVLLRAGEWTITVTADDHPLCGDGAADVQTITVTDPQMLVAHFPFDGSVADASGNGNDGKFMRQPTGTPTPAPVEIAPVFVDGHDGTASGALQFDGSATTAAGQQYLEVLQAKGLPLSMHDDLTITLWVKGLVQTDKRMFSEGTTTSNTPLYNVGTHNTGANGKADIFVRSLAATYNHSYSDRVVLDDTWHHLAWVDKGGVCLMYIDGVRDAAVFGYDDAVIGPLTMNRTALGAILRAAPGNFFTGVLDDVRLFNYALSEEEILAVIPEPAGCPGDADTHCTDLSYIGPDGGVAGTYTFTCTATDDSGDPVLYMFTLKDALGAFVRQIGPQALNTADIALAPGTWTVEVQVDDALLCRDKAADAVRSLTLQVRTEPPFMVSRYTFDGDLVDSGTSGNNGTALKSQPVDTTFEVVETTPEFGEGYECTTPGALVLNGDAGDTVVKLAHTANLPIYSKPTFSVAMWVKGLPQSDRRVFGMCSSTDNDPLWTLGTHNAGTDGTVDFYLRDDNGVNPVNHAHSTRTAFDGTWHHIAWTDDNGTVVLYVDGQVDGTNFSYVRPTAFTADVTVLGGLIRLARLQQSPPLDPMTSLFTGSIDDASLYNYILTQADVAALYGQGPTHCCPVDGDTHCAGLAVEGGPLAGTYTVTCTATDDSGDPILYAFGAKETGGAELAPASQNGNVATFDLTVGTWTVTVTVDDDPLCPDAAPDATCTQEIVVLRCPIEGDTHCNGVTVDGGPLEGVYTATCTATDDSSDQILYTFSATKAGGPEIGPDSQAGNVATFALTEGVWTITVTVDDDPTCDDAADDASCATEVTVLRCPVDGDTHCGGVSVEGGPGEGTYTATCTATDDSADPILYAFSAKEAGGAELAPATQDGSVATFALTEGVWTITVTVDDDPTCDDAAVDAVCSAQVEVVVGGRFKRGLVNADDKIDIADPIFLLTYLFARGPVPACMDAADANDDGSVNIADAIKILGHLFAQAGPLPPPFSACDVDPTEDVLTCDSFPACE